MASSYPAAVDSMLAPAATLAGPESHSDIEIKQNDAVVAIQTELGVDPAGSFSTVAARLADIESSLAGIGAGAGEWADFTSTWEGFSFSSVQARKAVIGDTVFIKAFGILNAAASQAPTLLLPETGSSDFQDNVQTSIMATGLDTSENKLWHAFGQYGTGNKIFFNRSYSDGENTLEVWNTASPFAWASGDEVTVTGWYERA